jgi:predicted amidohydrolase YtcJ
MKKVRIATARVAQEPVLSKVEGSSAVRSLCSQLAFIGILCAISAFAQDKKADVIFVNGNFYLGATNNANQVSRAGGAMSGHATAIAVANGKIIGIGPDIDFEKHFKGPHTQIIDLHGHFVMPGFNDAHSHLASGGFEKLNVNFIGARLLAEMQSRIAERVKIAAPGEWILGRGWDHTLWPEKITPTRQDLDKVTGDHPAIFGRVDGHIAVANSAALKAAGITNATQAKPGSAIDHDANGEPTGILREDPAMSLVYSKIPPKTMEQRRRGMELALKDARENGVTSDEDNSDWEDFLVLEHMQKEGKLTARVTEWLPFNESVENLKKMRAHHPADDVWLHTGMLKGYMDGSLGSRTAALLGPYSDDPHNSGLARFTQDKLNQMVRERADAGFQIGFHAIGDRGVEMALTAFAQAGHHPELRFRIEHDQIVEPSQIERYRQLRVTASVQPSHLLTDMRWVEDRVGKQRASSSYPWKSYLDAGVPIAFGTDYPVESINPFRGIYSAITRKNEAGTQEFYPQEKLTIDQAIAAYTTGSAYAENMENQKGTLEPDMLADFVVLDRDITKIPPADILKTKVLRTVVGGKTVYESPSAASDVAK